MSVLKASTVTKDLPEISLRQATAIVLLAKYFGEQHHDIYKLTEPYCGSAYDVIAIPKHPNPPHANTLNVLIIQATSDGCVAIRPHQRPVLLSGLLLREILSHRLPKDVVYVGENFEREQRPFGWLNLVPRRYHKQVLSTLRIQKPDKRTRSRR